MIQGDILFTKRNLIDSIYREARLAGIKVSFPEACQIVSERTAAGLSVDATKKSIT